MPLSFLLASEWASSPPFQTARPFHLGAHRWVVRSEPGTEIGKKSAFSTLAAPPLSKTKLNWRPDTGFNDSGRVGQGRAWTWISAFTFPKWPRWAAGDENKPKQPEIKKTNTALGLTELKLQSGRQKPKSQRSHMCLSKGSKRHEECEQRTLRESRLGQCVWGHKRSFQRVIFNVNF